jgi:type III pantothenate kinase
LFELAGIDFKAIDAIAIASVVPPLNYTLKTMAETYFHLTPLFVDHTTDTGLRILYEPAGEVGADRIVDAVAAVQKYGAPCIVVDFGTATTFNAINAQGEYVGGVITPGIMISSDALFERTAKLPRVDIRRPQKVIGSSTIAAMQSGLYHGFVGLVDGVLRKMIEEIGDPADGRAPRVIATGGLASLIATGSEFIELVDDTLTLEGLRLVFERTIGPNSKFQIPNSN